MKQIIFDFIDFQFENNARDKVWEWENQGTFLFAIQKNGCALMSSYS